MNWDMWAEIEKTLQDAGVKPIIAVVPDNRDPALNCGHVREDFWSVVRAWQDRQWSIAMHGYQHLYVTRSSGILRFNSRSEFAGLTRMEQQSKLESALGIFRREGVTPAAWIAPSHSFDWDTVEILRHCGIRIISDGFFQYPHRDRHGVLWVPQQLWRFRRVPAGIWTVCFHHNHWTSCDLKRFRGDLNRFADRIATLPEICAQYSARKKTIADRVVAMGGLTYIHGAQYFKPLRRALARG